MKFDDIRMLPVEKIADKDSILFLWVTFPMLIEGLSVMKNWGFRYRTCAFVWVKRNKKSDGYFTGMGFWTRANAEICLLGTRGHPKRISKAVKQICDERIMQHSKKPDVIRERIVELMGDIPRIEMFARNITEGWDVLGDEIDGKDIRNALEEIINDKSYENEVM